jgi:acyl-CoA reductase-like NAD-dependent aldehyde dehydrogenase
VPLQIGGELLPGGAEAEGRDRSRPERVAYRHALADRAAVSRALDATRAAQPAWAGRPPAERRALLDRAAAVLAQRRGDLIGAMIVDGAKTVAEADPEVSEAIDFARYYARALEQVDDLRECRMEPLGVVVVAPPWNFPLSIPAGGVLAALAAGNGVILKPAPEAVLVGWHLAQALWDAGIPKEALAFLPCPDGDVGRGLITDPRVDAVILTGSVETARRFLAWRADLTLFAETSGKNAVIVTALADRDQAIRDLVHSAFGHDGQKCSAASLAICEAEVYEDEVFRRQLRDAAASLPVGDAWDPSSRITPLTQPPGDALRRALTTLDEGEEWLLEPRRLGGDERLWSPGIKLGVRRASFFHRTECFGPVLGLMRAEDLDEAIDLADDTPFGLTSGIQSLDDREVDRWVERIQAGNLYVNRPTTGSHRRAPALRRLEGLLGGAGRQGRRTELRPPARALAASDTARRRRRVLAAGRGGAHARPRGDERRCGGRGRAAGERGQLCRGLARALRARARPERAHRRGQRVPLPPVPRDHRSRRCIASRAAARAPAGRARRAHRRRASDPEPARRRAWPWLEEHAGVTAVIESEAQLTGAPALRNIRATARPRPGLARRPRRGPPGGGRGDRRARDGHRPPRASLVSPRADGLARAPSLRQRDRARRHGVVRATRRLSPPGAARTLSR